MYYFPLITPDMKELPLYIKTIGDTLNETRVELPQGIGNYQLLYTESGSGMLEIGSKRYELQPGNLFVVGADIPHNYYSTKSPWKTIWLTFNGYAVHKIITFEHIVLKVSNAGFLYDFIYGSLDSEKNSSWSRKTSVDLYSFLLEIRDIIKSEANHIEYSPKLRLESVVSYINENLEKSLELQELCDIIDVSKSHLCRLFRQGYNMRPFEFITLVRLQKAKELMLTCPDIKIVELIKRIGYEDESYFCRKFKKYNNMTPNQFRKNGYL